MPIRHRLAVATLGLALSMGGAASVSAVAGDGRTGPVQVGSAAPAAPARPAALPSRLSDAEFWSLSERLSEPGGQFRSDNLVSNEIYMQTLIPELMTVVKPGRVYLGVGPEQNFTYIAALKPSMVFIIDVRRGNLHTQLMYKALFELSRDRVEFVSKLFSRARPDSLTPKSTVQEIFSAFARVETSEAAYKANLASIVAHLTRTRHLPLSDEDLEGIEYVYYNFYWFGPDLTYSSSTGGGGRGRFVTYHDLMVADDGQGTLRSYLANDANYAFMKDLHTRNMLVPVVGNFGGPKAIKAVGSYLREHGGLVSAFYLSNVEQYLSQDGLWYTFCGNVAALPLDESSTFIYSQSGGGGRGRGGGNLLSWYRPMLDDVKVNKCDGGGTSVSR